MASHHNTTQRHNTEDLDLNLHRRENLARETGVWEDNIKKKTGRKAGKWMGTASNAVLVVYPDQGKWLHGDKWNLHR
jgi:hypothetical protein